MGWNPFKDVYDAIEEEAGDFLDSTGLGSVIPGYNASRIGDEATGVKRELTGERAREDAINAQEASQTEAARIMKEIYDQQRADNAPWRAAGEGALSSLTSLDPKQILEQDPSYQFRLNEGLKSVNMGASARGGLGSGATQKALMRYGQDYASQEYSNSWNRLANIAGIGQTANSQGMQMAGQYGSNMANSIMGLGNAQAAAYMGQYQGNMGLLGNALGIYAAFA